MKQDVINIKGTRDGLVILINPAYDFELIKAKLRERITSAKGFFTGAKFAIQSPSQYTPEEKQQLAEICCQNGLIYDQNIRLKKPQFSSTKNNSTQNSSTKGRQEKFWTQGLTSQELKENCLLWQKNLRNGQVLNYDGHVTVLGDVHPGAQIIASGNIIVMGALKGIAHAGAKGDTKAVIMAYSLAPTQLRIADVIARAPEEQKHTYNYPEIAYLQNNQIIIEEYAANRCQALIS